MDKHSSFFVWVVSDKEKELYEISSKSFKKYFIQPKLDKEKSIKARWLYYQTY